MPDSQSSEPGFESPFATVSKIGHLVQECYAQKGPFTKQIATEGFSTVFGQLMPPL